MAAAMPSSASLGMICPPKEKARRIEINAGRKPALRRAGGRLAAYSVPRRSSGSLQATPADGLKSVIPSFSMSGPLSAPWLRACWPSLGVPLHRHGDSAGPSSPALCCGPIWRRCKAKSHRNGWLINSRPSTPQRAPVARIMIFGIESTPFVCAARQSNAPCSGFGCAFCTKKSPCA